MYYPIQIPYILNRDFTEHIEYRETTIDELSDFVICMWESISISDEVLKINNIIIADGCIDLVVDFDNRIIGFSGMTNTDFDFLVETPCRYFGFRLMPGAFYQLTGLNANSAMDEFLSLDEVDSDFDSELFFDLDFDNAKDYLIDYLMEKTKNVVANEYTKLFNRLKCDLPFEASELYELLYLSPRQCQRNFEKHFGIGPKMVLSIIRFQNCLELLISSEVDSSEVLSQIEYYDRSHYIKDFRKNIGITPSDFIKIYRE